MRFRKDDEDLQVVSYPRDYDSKKGSKSSSKWSICFITSIGLCIVLYVLLNQTGYKPLYFMGSSSGTVIIREGSTPHLAYNQSKIFKDVEIVTKANTTASSQKLRNPSTSKAPRKSKPMSSYC